MTEPGSEECAAAEWIRRCLRGHDVGCESCVQMGGGHGSRVWGCMIHAESAPCSVVLKLYDAGCTTYCGLTPSDLARKHALALTELPSHGILTPRLLGWAVSGQEAALLTDRTETRPFTDKARVEAARALARLHGIGLDVLGDELVSLVSSSTPNRHRILNGVRGMADHLDGSRPGWRGDRKDLSGLVESLLTRDEPRADDAGLVHGDYFSANLLWTDRGVLIVDWDLVSPGDSMWDLGFLVAADRGLSSEEVQAVVAAYAQVRPVVPDRLSWNRNCWEAFWQLRELCNEPAGGPVT